MKTISIKNKAYQKNIYTGQIKYKTVYSDMYAEFRQILFYRIECLFEYLEYKTCLVDIYYICFES